MATKKDELKNPEKTNSKQHIWLKIANEKILLSSEKTAQFFGVTSRTLLEWVKKGAPKADRGWWDIQAIYDWRSNREKNDYSRKTKAEADWKEKQAARAEFELEVKQGLYFTKNEVVSEWARRVVEVKTGLLSLSRKVAGEFTDPDIRIEIEKAIQREVYDILSQYCREGKFTSSRPIKSKAKSKTRKR